VDYLAGMLASFTRIESFAYSVRVRHGVWRRHRVSELDVDSLIRLSNVLNEDQRFSVYRRIGDLCLFVPGVFAEYVSGQADAPWLNRWRRHSLEDYEELGQAFYALAAQHESAAWLHIDGVLATLAQQLQLAEKPLQFVSESYLALRKHAMFGL
jgi:hypothetical protein